MIDMKDVFVPAPNVAFRRIGSQVALVNPSTNQLLTLNETGSITWEALDGACVAEIIEIVKQNFEEIGENVTQEVCDFLQSLVDRNLVAQTTEK